MVDQFLEIFNYIHEKLSNYDIKREEILVHSRKIVRSCSVTIKHVHRKEFNEAEELLSGIRNDLSKLSPIQEDSINTENNINVAFQEYVEALTFYQFATHREIFKPKEDQTIPLIAYLHGLCDLVGELRRFSLDHLKETSDFFEAERAMLFMEDIYNNLLTLDYPSGLITGIRRKTDLARNIVEKTRGDLVLAYNRGKIEEKIKEFLEKK
ncbi:MAG: hypothetical protein ACFFD1_00375 [Candidatus Thorarchaeota archaeon]